LGDHLGGGEEVVEDQGAEHGAFEVDEGEDDGLAAFEVFEMNRVALFVMKSDVAWNCRTEVLGDADVLEEGGGGFASSGSCAGGEDDD
jgi:hypothetical protein